MEVVHSKGLSIAQRSAFVRRCRIFSCAALIILGVLFGYYTMNKEDNNIKFITTLKRVNPENNKNLDTANIVDKSKEIIDLNATSTVGEKSHSNNLSEDVSIKKSLNNVMTVEEDSKKDTTEERESLPDSDTDQMKTSTKETSLLDVCKNRMILCYGDSITYGSTGHGNSHPYTMKLQQLIGPTVSIHRIGYPGKTTSELLELSSSISRNTSISDKISLAIILGGTNDITEKSGTSTDILDNLIKLHKSFHRLNRRVYTIALSVPYMYGPYANETIRLEVNEGLYQYAKTCSHRTAYLDMSFLQSGNTKVKSESSGDVVVSDSEETASIQDSPSDNVSVKNTEKKRRLRHLRTKQSDITFNRILQMDSNSLYADDVHPSSDGYDLIAQHVFDLLTNYTIDTAFYNKMDC